MLFAPGQSADISAAADLLEGLQPQRLIADRAYDADWLRLLLDSKDIEAVIPCRRTRKQQIDHDRVVYKKRNLIERTINKLKGCRKIATRYEKTSVSFAALSLLAAIFINLKVDVNTP